MLVKSQKKISKKDATLDETAVIGKAGLEVTFDKQLRGESGGQIEILTEEGEIKEVLLEKERKKDCDISTLDNYPNNLVRRATI